MLHHGEVEGVPSRESGLLEGDLPCAADIPQPDGKDFRGEVVAERKGRGSRFSPRDGDEPVQDLLVDLGVGDENLFGVSAQLGLHPLAVGVGSADEVHRHVRVKEDHDPPRSAPASRRGPP